MAKNSAERASSGGMATLLMIVAVVTTVGLLVWLSFASRPPESAAMVTNDADPAGMAGPTAPSVLAAEFGAAIGSFEGRDVNLVGVTVSTVVNDQLIWVDVPTDQGMTPFTVRLLPGAASTPPAAQSMIDVEGRVLAKTDSVLNAWQQAGAIADANVRATLEFGSYFLEATAIRPAAGSN